MKSSISIAVGAFVVLALYSCSMQEEKTAPAKPSMAEAKKAPPAEKAREAQAPEAKAPEAKVAEAKAKPVKATGDVGLLDLEKNYMILVTKEGKLITVDFSDKTGVTQIVPSPAKMEDIGLGSSATVEFQTMGEKKIVTKLEYKAAKGGD